MDTPIYPCLWFDGTAREAAELYTSLFENSRITQDNGLVVNFEVESFKIMGLNGGPMFKITQSLSLYVTCESDEEIDRLHDGLIRGGSSMIPLGAYPWSPRYAWIADRYGMTWQLSKGELPAGEAKIMPSFLFVGNQFGNAQRAMTLYTSLFPESGIQHQELYGPNEGPMAGSLKFGQFTLFRSPFAAMDGYGEHSFAFSEGVSLVVECRDQNEIDLYWNTLISNGGEESQCGWLKDPFGVSWQIIPKDLSTWMSDPLKGPQVMQRLLKMRKLIISQLDGSE